MAAPTAAARSAPAGIRIDDGFSTLIAFATIPTISFWEKTVTPPGIDGGDAIDTTTMHNVLWRSRASRALKTLTDSSLKAAYDPNLYNSILALINLETTITVHFPDGSTLAFFGFLQKFEPGDLAEGTQPECTITIVPTNIDPVNHVEAAPVLTSVAGT